MKKISFVIPCFRSENTIGKVIGEIIAETAKLAVYDYEIIAVDDSSPDCVFAVLEKMARDNRRIKVLSMAKNFGQHAGMMAGIYVSEGDFIVFLDDDGQCPVDQLKALIEPLENDWDIAIARYGRKKQSIFKNMCSAVNEFVADLLIDKPRHLQMGNFMAVTRFAADEMKRYTGPYPYISGLLFRTSTRIINVPMEERERMEGGTTYTLRKLFALWLNSFTAFSVKPLRFAALAGLVFSGLGFVYGAAVVVRKIYSPVVTAGWSSVMAVILFLGGIILFVLGLIGEYIGRIYMSINQMPQYVVRKRINIKKPDDRAGKIRDSFREGG